jgi:hypothetical protein
MSSQIFKRKVPDEFLFNLLNLICIKTEKYYIINYDSYKKGIFNEYISDFVEKCREYYYLSKRKYLDKKFTYKSFITIVRQICNFNKIKYNSEIKYEHSNYAIIYYIYF